MRYRAIFKDGVGLIAEYENGVLTFSHPDYYTDGSAKSPFIVGDLPGYESPVTGKWIEGRAARREDLARTGCRPYEGREQELKEAQRQQNYHEQRDDARLHEAASRAFYQMPPEKRRQFY